MRRGHQLLLALAVLLGGTRAFAQQPMRPYEEAPPPEAGVISPYGEAPPPGYVPPPPPLQPVPPPLVAPPPGAYYQQPYYAQPYAAPEPRMFHEELQPNYGLMVAGLVVLGASWSINAASAYVADEWKLAVPVVGPFMEIGNINTAPGYEDNKLLVGLLVFDGLIETAGAVMLVAGALTHHRVKVYDRPRVSVVPTAGPQGGGLAAFGTF